MSGAWGLETARLGLRGWQHDDHAFLAEYYADPDRARFVGGRLDPEQAWRRLAMMIGHFAMRGFGPWAVEEKDSGELVGSVGLWRSEGWPELELQYWLSPSARGKGYAVEAGTVVRAFALGSLDAASLVSYIHRDNLPSMRVAELLGAERDDLIELLTYGPHWIYRYR